MIKIQQTISGQVEYEDLIESYNYDVPTLISNGAIKITVEYPTSVIVLTPSKSDCTK